MICAALTGTLVLAMMGLKTHEKYQKKYLDRTSLGTAAFRAVIRVFFQHFLHGGKGQYHRKDDHRQFQGRHNFIQPENSAVLFYRSADNCLFFNFAENRKKKQYFSFSGFCLVLVLAQRHKNIAATIC
jgi:hypothetical protein